MPTEQRAFAAVSPNGEINLTSISEEIELAKQWAGANWRYGWNGAYSAGWRIRPVIIRLEEQDNG